MKTFLGLDKLLVLTAAILITAATALCAFGQAEPFSINTSPLPPSTGFVNDFAGAIDEATRQNLEAKLADLKNSTNPPVEIAVAVVRTTDGRDIFDYSLAVARGWKIGTKDDDNPSALLLVAIDDRKYFTQVSRDLEDELPDGVVGSLQRKLLVPEFKKGNYGKGISDTIDAYIETIRNKGNAAGVRPAEETQPRRSLDGGATGLICCGGIILIILISIFSRSKGGPSGRDRDRWGGGGFGGGGGGASSALPWIIGGLLEGSGSGGSSSSSGWGGGSSDGGGWGGFGGGGDFGGGGGGGDW